MSPSLIRIFITPLLGLLFWMTPIRVTRNTLLKMAFTFWIIGGASLLISGATRLSSTYELGQTDMTLFIGGLVVATIIGIAKGKFVLSKTSKKNITRIEELTNSEKLSNLYSMRSWILIEVMLLISASLTWFDVPDFWRGLVNLAVGLALIFSSLMYLKTGLFASKTPHQAI